MTSCPAFSQGLKPQVIKSHNDTLFAFTKSQAQALAKTVVENQFLKKESALQKRLIDTLTSQTLVQEAIITEHIKKEGAMSSLILGQDMIIKTEREIAESYYQQMQILERQLKQERKIKKLTVGGAVIAIAATLFLTR